MSNEFFCLSEHEQALEFGQYDEENGMQAYIHPPKFLKTASSSHPINSHPTAEAMNRYYTQRLWQGNTASIGHTPPM